MSGEITGVRRELLSRRKFILGAAFLSAAGVAAVRQPNTRVDYLGNVKLDAVLPEAIGGWQFVASSGLVVPPEDQLSRAVYSQLLTRVYSNGKDPPMMLLVAQSATQTGILQIHRPEICYTAGGYQLANLEPHSIRLASGALNTMSLSATSDGRTEQIVYWTRIGEHLPQSWRAQREVVALDNLRRIIPDAVMVRVSTIDHDKGAALAAIDEFVRAMLNSVRPDMRRVFIA